MSEFHFLRPAWFIALVPAAVLLVLLWRRRGGAAGWRDIVAPALLSHLLLDSGQPSQRIWLALLGIGWLLAVAALAGPTWERQPQPLYRVPADRVLVLDMSPSMAAADVKPDRLTRARLLIREVLAYMQEGRSALIVFGAESHVVTPLTDDVATIEALLPALSAEILPAPGDRGGPALRTAGDLLERVTSARGEVLLLSDGVSDPADSLNAVHDLRKRGVATSVLGVGTLAGAPEPAAEGGFAATFDGKVRLTRLDETGLVALANAGGGRYQRLDQGQFAELFRKQIDRNPSRAQGDGQGSELWVEKGPWLLLPLILIAASGFRRGWLGAWLVVLLIPPPQAYALSWQDLWFRPDQQASRLLERGEASAAAERFDDPDWRALARYQAGDYAAAAEEFAGQDADSRYNRGNALARSGRLQEALAAYDLALQQQPEHDDARFNRALVERLLRQQQESGGDRDGDSSGKPQSDKANQDGRSASAKRQEPSDSSTAQSKAGDSPSPPSSPSPLGAIDNNGESGSADELETDQASDKQRPGNDRKGDASPEHDESLEQARADVSPSLNKPPTDQRNAPARSVKDGDEARLETPRFDQQATMSERELALEQWLRQVPDDPAGLLRRKFMLEHLYRQQRQNNR